jgi:hypothetical protein
MPDYCKISPDPVQCYREYYRREKMSFAKWVKIPSRRPDWLDA